MLKIYFCGKKYYGISSQHCKITWNEIGRINIPLALILESGEITTTNDKNESGVFLHLTLRTSEFGSKDVYINVKDLNEIAGEDTDTIKIEVDSQ